MYTINIIIFIQYTIDTKMDKMYTIDINFDLVKKVYEKLISINNTKILQRQEGQ